MRVRVGERTGERVEEEWAGGRPEVYLVSFVFSFTGVFGTHRACAASWCFGVVLATSRVCPGTRPGLWARA